MKRNYSSTPSLMLGVFCCDPLSQKKPVDNHPYPELKSLRQQIEQEKNGPQHLPYSTNKKKVALYKGIFFIFSFLFFSLASLIYYKTTNWTCSFFFANFVMIKTAICSLSLLFAILSLGCALYMRTEKEAVNHLTRRAKKQLHKVYLKKLIDHSIPRFFPFGDHYLKAANLKQQYSDAKDRIENRQIETFLLIERIRNRKDLEARKKEDLFNQAILEFHDALHGIIHTFRDFATP